jgi:hypothetical protein
MVTAAVRPLPLPDFILSSAVGRLLTDLFAKPLSSFTTVTLLLLACELALNVLIVKKVPYTEIDWQAYVDEVEGVIVRSTFGLLDQSNPPPPACHSHQSQLTDLPPMKSGSWQLQLYRAAWTHWAARLSCRFRLHILSSTLGH